MSCRIHVLAMEAVSLMIYALAATFEPTGVVSDVKSMCHP